MASQKITNIVVVMLENRSYDNLLGWLYNSGNDFPYNEAPPGQAGQPGPPLVAALNGLTGNESNPDPSNPNGSIPVSNAAATTIPSLDPGEVFDDMAQQIYGLKSVPDEPVWPPGSPTPPPPAPPPAGNLGMQGFTLNYAAQGGSPADCMTYFTPAQVPVSAWLANHFAVCDQWFGSVPTQTFTNRTFMLCAAPSVHHGLFESYSYVDDMQYLANNSVVHLIDTYRELPTIFEALDVAFNSDVSGDPPNWKVYFSDYSIAAITVPYVYNAGKSSGNVNVATYDDSDWGDGGPRPAIIGGALGSIPTTFVQDVTAGKLPKLSLIEPRYATDVANSNNLPNCNHPGVSALLPFLPTNKTPIDVANGEIFLAEIYNLLAGSSLWDSCLLIITYDEHGGMYDHVPPPAAPPPVACNTLGSTPGLTIPNAKDDAHPAANGFEFNYYGCRVPAIIVSPLIAPGSTIRPTMSSSPYPPAGSYPFDHTSIIRTVWDCFGLSSILSLPSLTQRDLNAPSLMPFLTASNSTGLCPVYAQTSIVIPDGSKSAWTVTINDSGQLSAASGGTSPQVVFLQDTAAPLKFYQLMVAAGNPQAIAATDFSFRSKVFSTCILMKSPGGDLWLVEVTNGVLGAVPASSAPHPGTPRLSAARNMPKGTRDKTPKQAQALLEARVLKSEESPG
jgi:phospholipase C